MRIGTLHRSCDNGNKKLQPPRPNDALVDGQQLDREIHCVVEGGGPTTSRWPPRIAAISPRFRVEPGRSMFGSFTSMAIRPFLE